VFMVRLSFGSHLSPSSRSSVLHCAIPVRTYVDHALDEP
jgi:hypothetical protein